MRHNPASISQAHRSLLVNVSHALCSFILALIVPAAASAADRTLGSFRDWTAMQYGSGNAAECMAFTQPVKSEGAYSKRGDPFLFVTRRIASAERGRVTLETGYPYKAGSTASVIVDDLKLELETQGSTAWLDPADDAARLLDAMRAGKELVVKGTSSHGTDTVDRYSLYGFTAAYRAIAKACPD